MLYSETLFYLRTYLSKYIVYLCFLYVFAVVSGIFYGHYFTVDATTLFGILSSEFEGMSSMGPVTTMLIIFFNNTIKTFLVLMGGLFLGIAPLFFVFLNGFVVGIIAYFFYTSSQLSVFILGIVAHGILEIPAFIIASAIALHLGVCGFNWLFKRKKQKTIAKDITQGMNVFTHVIIPLFLIAAFIETFISSYILSFIS